MAEGLKKYATLVNLVAFHIGWLACVIGAGKGRPSLGPLVVPVLVALQVALISQNSRRESCFIIATALFGFLADTGMIYGEVYEPVRDVMPPPLIPLWMVALWVNFGAALNLSLRWFRGRYAAAALFGAAGGPFAYFAGAKLKAVVLNPDPLRSFAVLVIVWAVSVPFLYFLSEKIVGSNGSR
ncbi:MAG: DUF2878 family protein [Deltaproteobacteria bacterium]|nr:DUF2878 family protein [Deltaproteobacteria bacterium]NIS76144.1 DUF2878 family protein [Deltaproteobacteria bacterium]